MLAKIFAALCQVPLSRKFLWKCWYQFLASQNPQREWTFMNFGYESLPLALGLTLRPEDEPDRYCIQLYHHLVHDLDLSGKEVLEVGSGRGGGASYIQRYFKPKRMIGIDYSQKAVGFCSKRHQEPGLSFHKGDAEAIPLGDDQMDIILNLESSHCYGNAAAFFREVHRVIRPGGYFLYADFRDKTKVDFWVEELKASGLKLIKQTDITKNVLTALDLDNERKIKLIEEFVPKLLQKSFLDFAGIKGAAVYQLFKNGDLVYFSFVLQKS
jgi:ubiquinone/menaquinone biosynthesis C-methylase UbiE